MADRQRLVERLIACREPVGPILDRLRDFAWDSGQPLVTLHRARASEILDRFLAGDLQAADLTEWAAAIEGRDDIDSATVHRLITELATPEVFGPVSESSVRVLRASLNMPTGSGKELTAVERGLLVALLAGRHSVLAILREQAAVATAVSRTWSDVGCNTQLAVAPPVLRVSPATVTLGDVGYRLQGSEEPGHAVLWIRDGVLSELMYYNWTDTWPDHPELAEVHFLPHNSDGGSQPSKQRDMVSVVAALSA